MFRGNSSTHGPTLTACCHCCRRPSKQARMQLVKGVGIFFGVNRMVIFQQIPKNSLTYPWFNIEAWKKVHAFSGKRICKSYGLMMVFLVILELVKSCRLCLFDSGFLKSIQYFELTEYVDICSKGLKGWKHQELFLKLIWRDNGQVYWKSMWFERGMSTDAVWARSARCASVALFPLQWFHEGRENNPTSWHAALGS